MKFHVLVALAACACLTACNEQTYQADVRVINLANDELIVRWHDKNNDHLVDLSLNDNALGYGEISDRYSLLNQDPQGNVYTFDAQNYLTQTLIEQTSFALADQHSYYVFAYGDPSSEGEQKAALGAIYRYNDAIADNQYRVHILHTYFPMMANLDVYLNGELIKEDLKYGSGTGFVTATTYQTHLVIVSANESPSITSPLIDTHLIPESGELQVVFVAPKTSDHAQFSAHPFVVKNAD